MPSNAPALRYRAFLSYSHSDEAHARWLHRRLEAYRLPRRIVATQGRFGVVPRDVRPVFRDRDELPSAGDLGDTLRDALGASEALILVCSPAAARSRWVSAEVEAFRAMGRGDRILCFIVEGDPLSRVPGSACFPPALLAPSEPGAPENEPLAADARREADGRERAFLRIVAGLVGVGFDDLARRDAQRRQRFMAAVVAASLAIASGATLLGLIAHLARQDAERRQRQSEDLVNWMLRDLNDLLQEVGNTDVMERVLDRVTAYEENLDSRDRSTASLQAQSRKLTQVGLVWVERGNYTNARVAFDRALAIARRMHAAAPQDGQRIFDLAQAEHGLGTVAYAEGRNPEASQWWSSYADHVARLPGIDPSNRRWALEHAYGLEATAVIAALQGHESEARDIRLKTLGQYRAWIDAWRPQSNSVVPPDTRLQLEVRYSLANSTSWLGTGKEKEGRLAEAEQHFAEAIDVLRFNESQDPKNARWKADLLNKLLLLSDAQAHQGRVTQAIQSIREASQRARNQSARDPGNHDKRFTLAQATLREALLLRHQQAPEAPAVLADASRLLAESHHASPSDSRVAVDYARALDDQAARAMDHGDLAEASRLNDHALGVLRVLAKEDRNERIRIALATALLRCGMIHASRSTPDEAQRSWSEARDLLAIPNPADLPFRRVETLARILGHLGRHDEADALRQRLAHHGFQPLVPFPSKTRP